MRAAIVALTLLLSVSVAADCDDGVAAYEAGDYKTAFNEFKPFAEQGEEDAAIFLGNQMPLKYQRRKGMASPVLYTYK